MRQIDRAPHHTPPAEIHNARHQLGVDTAGLTIEPSTESRGPASYLAHFKTIVRRPPELPLSFLRDSGKTALDAVITPKVAQLAGTGSMEFAYALAELAWRLEPAALATQDPDIHEGHAVLSKAARMYEHLFILQTEQEG